MNKGTRTAAEATRYPNLFRGTYWGAFNLANNADMITADILRNRNAFAVEWRLKGHIDGLTRYPATGRGTTLTMPKPTGRRMGRLCWWFQTTTARPRMCWGWGGLLPSTGAGWNPMPGGLHP
jgi:hypothetical protein